MSTQRHGIVETQSAVVDVLLLDVFAQIESLLRSGRELQRELLRVRGVPRSTTTEQQRKAVARAQALVMEILTDSRGLVNVVRQLRVNTNGLARRVERGRTRARASQRDHREQAAKGNTRGRR